MPIIRAKTIADTCDTFKLISVKTKEDNGNCLLTFAPQGVSGSTVLMVADSGKKDPSYTITTSDGDIAVNVSMACSALAALSGKDQKYADIVEAAWYEHLDAMLLMDQNHRSEFDWSGRFKPLVGCVLHVNCTPSCVERNGYVNFADFDVSGVKFEERGEYVKDILGMFEPADEIAIQRFAENKKASRATSTRNGGSRKPQVARS